VTGGALLGAFVDAGAPTDLALIGSVTVVLALSWWISKVPEPALQKSTRVLFDALRVRWQASTSTAAARDTG
jgi:hypothetical protein